MKAQVASSSSINKSAANTPKVGSRLSLWLKKLPEYSIACNSVVAKNIINELDDDNCTSERLALLIQQDPPLALKLVISAQQKMQSKDGDIQGLVHLISLLGVNAVEKQLHQPKKIQHQGQNALISASLCSAHVARHLLPLKHGILGERFFLPTLLFNSPFWLMWQAAPKLMQTVHERGNRESLNTLFNRNLGFSLQSLLDRTEVFLPLPTLTLKALAINFSDHLSTWAKLLRLPSTQVPFWLEKNTADKRRFYAIEMGIFLVNQFVLAEYFDEKNKHRDRWTRLLALHLGLEKSDILALAKDAIEGITIPHHLRGDVSPQFRLNGQHRVEGDDSHSTKSHQKLSPLHQLRQTEDTESILPLAMALIRQTIEPDQCLILSMNTPANDTLSTQSYHGFEKATIKNLKLPLSESGDCIKKVLMESTVLSIDEDKFNAILPKLPAALMAYWRPQPFGLMSLFSGGEPFAVILCSHKEWKSGQHQRFKLIGKELTQALKRC